MMATSYFRLVTSFLVIALFFAAQGIGQEIEGSKATAFQETANDLLGGCAIQMMEYRHFPYFGSWGILKGGDFTADLQKKFRSFPGDLIKALGDRESADHETAVHFLAVYASLARCHASQLAEKDLPVAVELAMAPHTDKIRKGLVASLQAKANKTRLMAALALLFLDEGHAKANEVLQASEAFDDDELRSATCRLVSLGRLTSPQVIDYLGRMLKHRDPDVRECAAGAVITLGTSAWRLTPALIAFLRTGKGAEGSYSYPLAVALPQTGNLALMALEGLKEHARPAMPTILERFPNSSEKDQLAMFACLVSAGCKDDVCLSLMRKSLQSEKVILRLTAACALLHLATADRDAIQLVTKALAVDGSKQLAIEVCQRLGPPSREIAACIIPLLDSKDENVRINSTYALASIGPHAAQAIPGIEKLLAREENGMTHTFLSTQAAAYALAKIGGKEAAAALLRVADSKANGARYAMRHLHDLGDDLPPTTLTVLKRAIKIDSPPNFEAESGGPPKLEAAIALCNIGERARPVRRDMELLLEDPEIGWILDTALRRIPAKSR